MKRTVIVALAALGFSLAALSVAWACTSDASMYVNNYNPAPGEVIRAMGQDYYADAQVELRWGSSTGPVLTTVQTTPVPDSEFVEDGGARGTFAVDVAIPADAAPGDHLLFAASPGAREAPVRLTVPGEPAPPEDSGPEPVNTDPQPEPVNTDPQPEPVNTDPQPEPVNTDSQPAPASGTLQEFTPAPGEEQVLAGANQAVAADPAPEGESAPAPAVNTDWRNTHGALLHAEAAPVVNTDWRSTHGALLHAVPDSLEGSDRGAFADAVAANEANGYSWTGAFRGDGPMGMGAGLALFAPGLMLLFGGFTVATVARRREKVPVTDQ